MDLPGNAERTASEAVALLSGDEYFLVIGAQSTPGDVTYHFWAEDSSGNQAQSPEYTAEITETRPRPPENLIVVASLRGALRVEWDAPTENVDGSPLEDLRGYNVYRMTESGGTPVLLNLELVPATATSFLDENLGDGKTYYYVVRAVNSQGDQSDDSNEASGTTQEPEESDYTFIIILLIIVVLIVVLLFILLGKRSRAEEAQEEPHEEAPPGEDETQSEQM
jgi:hypothetical protein